MTIRVASIEDDGRYRASLDALMRLSPGIELAGSFATPAAALEALERTGSATAWDVVLMDLELPGMSGIEATRHIKRVLPATPVVVLTVFEEPPLILEAICAGADGYLTKSTPPDELLAQIRAVVHGGSPLTAGVASTVLDLLRHLEPPGPPGQDGSAPGLTLTAREQEVLRCLMAGMAYKHVAARLDISIDTVRTHIRHMYGKLQVHSVAEAVTRALREGLV
ncbi:MAG: response regulator [Gemmatimonadota bacterium]